MHGEIAAGLPSNASGRALTGLEAFSVAVNCATREKLPWCAYRALKRLLDIAGALIGIALFVPVAAVVAGLVWIDLGSPILFRQMRIGRHGKTFEIVKFRTMDHRERFRGDDHVWSRVGRALRRSRLDELPQLYNVLRGDMTLVGPRPLLAADLCRCNLKRLLVRPGITGWAQIQGGRDVNAIDKAALDAWYVAHASLRLDLLILTHTIPFLLRGDRRNPDAIALAWRELSLEYDIGLEVEQKPTARPVVSAVSVIAEGAVPDRRCAATNRPAAQ